MEKVVANLLCGLIIEDEQGRSLRMTGLDTRRCTKITIVSPGHLDGRSEAVAAMRQVYAELCSALARQVVELCGQGEDIEDIDADEMQSPLGMAAERIIQLLEKREEK